MIARSSTKVSRSKRTYNVSNHQVICIKYKLNGNSFFSRGNNNQTRSFHKKRSYFRWTCKWTWPSAIIALRNSTVIVRIKHCQLAKKQHGFGGFVALVQHEIYSKHYSWLSFYPSVISAVMNLIFVYIRFFYLDAFVDYLWDALRNFG